MFAVEDLFKTFALPEGQTLNALDGVSCDIPAGKFFTLLGPSGCGKTTMLRSIAGLERPDRGTIRLDDQVVFDAATGLFVPPNRRGVGMVFQSYAIWPHMTVFENVAFPLRVNRKQIARDEVENRVGRALELVELGGIQARSATKLSGGQQQRLALARALVAEPRLLLLDEPLSNLDAKLRESMRFELRKLQRELGITTVYVTHDQAEALALSDNIAVMNAGRIVQIGDPDTIYGAPANRFVADFIGASNLFDAKVARNVTAGSRDGVETEIGLLHCRFADAAQPGQSILVSVRPESVHLESPGEGDSGDGQTRLSGRIVERLFLGETVDYMLAVGNGRLRVRTAPDAAYAPGDMTVVAIPDDKCRVIFDDGT